MTLTDDLLREISATFSSAITPNFPLTPDPSDVFEAYVFSLVLEAARTEGAAIVYRDVRGRTPTRFVFRTSPGHIYSTNRDYSHAVIQFPDKPPLEAHIGVRVVGKSEVLHECDVAVIEQIEAEICRRRQVPPRSHKVLIAVECKFYSTPLELHLARAFIGLTTDLSARRPVFVSNTSSDSIEKLLTGRNRDWDHNIIPSSTVDVMRLRHKFQDAFQKYKAS